MATLLTVHQVIFSVLEPSRRKHLNPSPSCDTLCLIAIKHLVSQNKDDFHRFVTSSYR
jgi:hypothetical protein